MRDSQSIRQFDVSFAKSRHSAINWVSNLDPFHFIPYSN